MLDDFMSIKPYKDSEILVDFRIIEGNFLIKISDLFYLESIYLFIL